MPHLLSFRCQMTKCTTWTASSQRCRITYLQEEVFSKICRIARSSLKRDMMLMLEDLRGVNKLSTTAMLIQLPKLSIPKIAIQLAIMTTWSLHISLQMDFLLQSLMEAPTLTWLEIGIKRGAIEMIPLSIVRPNQMIVLSPTTGDNGSQLKLNWVFNLNEMLPFWLAQQLSITSMGMQIEMPGWTLIPSMLAITKLLVQTLALSVLLSNGEPSWALIQEMLMVLRKELVHS